MTYNYNKLSLDYYFEYIPEILKIIYPKEYRNNITYTTGSWTPDGPGMLTFMEEAGNIAYVPHINSKPLNTSNILSNIITNTINKIDNSIISKAKKANNKVAPWQKQAQQAIKTGVMRHVGTRGSIHNGNNNLQQAQNQFNTTVAQQIQNAIVSGANYNSASDIREIDLIVEHKGRIESNLKLLYSRLVYYRYNNNTNSNTKHDQLLTELISVNKELINNRNNKEFSPKVHNVMKLADKLKKTTGELKEVYTPKLEIINRLSDNIIIYLAEKKYMLATAYPIPY